jgi:hypothetical protein
MSGVAPPASDHHQLQGFILGSVIVSRREFNPRVDTKESNDDVIEGIVAGSCLGSRPRREKMWDERVGFEREHGPCERNKSDTFFHHTGSFLDQPTINMWNND